MLVTKTNPVGVDKKIQFIQQRLWDKLGWANWNSYGRCQRNTNDYGYIAEVHVGGGEYREVFWDDSLDAISFFHVADRVENLGGNYKANVALIVFLDLVKVTGSQERMDEEIRLKVAELIGLEVDSIETGLQNVLREYAGSRRENLKAVDLQPRHAFRVNFTLIYTHC